jgi:oligoribonuclease NrnB/cAMP/cGMP phosphodiesterase (DHH superfamily)
MRIVTRPDFDGVICAVLLYEAEDITAPVKWVEPNDMQRQRVAIYPTDIIANLPYHENCRLWFDHHFTNRIDQPFNGAFQPAPSAARLIYNYYQSKLEKDYLPLVEAADRIDAADLSEDEVLHPEKYDFVMLSLTISNQDEPDEPYWNRLVELLRRNDVQGVMADPEVKKHCDDTIVQNNRYRDLLEEYTRMQGQVAITDFRPLGKAPSGNRFLVYSMFPEAVVHARIRFDSKNPDRVVVNVGHSIFNRNCRVNVGLLLSPFNGGGHPGAGSCRFSADKTSEYLPRIIDTLVRNEPIDG